MTPSGSLLFLLSLAACGCSMGALPKPALPQPIDTAAAFRGESCSIARPPTEPDLMAWDPGSRAKLAALRSHGVVAVRYRTESCNVELEVLPNCIGAATYDYVPYAAIDRKVARSNEELFAQMPLGAARIGGKLGAGRALRTDYTLVGMAALPPRTSFDAGALRGVGCDRATHVVSRIYLGGFAMFAGEAEALEASASIFGASGGGSHAIPSEHVAEEGVPEACEEARNEGTENARCAVPLRIGLLPIAGLSRGGCPVDTTFDGKQCVRREVVTQIECPKGTVLEGTKCRAEVSTKCAGGLHFEPNRGCVPNMPPPPPIRPSAKRTPDGGSTLRSSFFLQLDGVRLGSEEADARARAIVEETHGPALRACFLEGTGDWVLRIRLDFVGKMATGGKLEVEHDGRDARGTHLGKGVLDCATQAWTWPWRVPLDEVFRARVKPFVAISTGISAARSPSGPARDTPRR